MDRHRRAELLPDRRPPSNVERPVMGWIEGFHRRTGQWPTMAQLQTSGLGTAASLCGRVANLLTRTHLTFDKPTGRISITRASKPAKKGKCRQRGAKGAKGKSRQPIPAKTPVTLWGVTADRERPHSTLQ